MRKGALKTKTWMATQSGKGSVRWGRGLKGWREGRISYHVVRLAKMECIYIFFIYLNELNSVWMQN